jgi:virginiamycin B lyase
MSRIHLRRSVPVVAAALLTACASAAPSSLPGSAAAAPSREPSAGPSAPSDAETTAPAASAPASTTPEPVFTAQTFPVGAGSAPHDVAPADDGGVWYTAQDTGELGWLDPGTGEYRVVPLGAGSRPHGVIVGPDGAPWITDGGLDAIVRVDPVSLEVVAFPLPTDWPDANLNTAAFDADDLLWFTDQNGYYGSLDPRNAEVRMFPAPRGPGPYGITATPDGEIYFSSLAGSYLGAIDRSTGEVRELDPPTPGAGLRRAWSDSQGRIWVSEWFAGQVGVYDPATEEWREWRLPGDAPEAYSVYVDETDAVWLSDFGANAIVRFDPETETFMSFPAESQPADVRQMLGRPGEVWGAESAADRLIVIRTER